MGMLKSIDSTDKEHLGFDRSAVERRYQSLTEERDLWVPKWKEIRDFINPWRGLFASEDNKKHYRRDDKIYDGVGYDAVSVLAAGIMFGLTPRSRPWFRLGFEDPELSDYEPARYYLDEVAEVLYADFSRSNVYNSFHTTYAESGTFGTGCMGIWDGSGDRLLQTKTFTTGTYSLGIDSYGTVNRFCREIQMSADQILQYFGEKALTADIRIKQWYNEGNIKNKMGIRHMIEPNPDYKPGSKFFNQMEFREFYYLSENKTAVPLRTSGYNEFPIVAPRWDVVDDSVYGYGPGWYALADCRGLQLMAEDTLIALELMIKPPVSTSGSSAKSGVNLFPGGVSITEDANRDTNAVRPVFQVNPDFNAIEAKMQQVRTVVKRRFFADLFMMLDSLDKGQMTAREVIERSQEKMTLIGPSVERYQGEMLNPLIERAFNMAYRAGKLPPPPPELQGKDFKVEYVSPLSIAQKMAGITALEQGMAFVGNIATLFPNATKKVKEIEVIDKYWDMLGVPSGLLRTDEEVEQMVQAEQQAMQMAQQEQQMLNMTQGVKNMAQAPMEDSNALTALMGPNVASLNGGIQ